MWANCLIFSRKRINTLSETDLARSVSTTMSTGLNGVIGTPPLHGRGLRAPARFANCYNAGNPRNALDSPDAGSGDSPSGACEEQEMPERVPACSSCDDRPAAVKLTNASAPRSVSVRRSGFKAQNIAFANHFSIHKGSKRMTYRFEVKVFEAFRYRTYFGTFSVDSPLTGVGQEILPVIELYFNFCGKIYTLADAITWLPSVIFFNNTFLGLRFFTQDFSMVEGLNREDEACFIYDLVQGEGAGDVIYFPVDVNTKCRVAQVQD